MYFFVIWKERQKETVTTAGYALSMVKRVVEHWLLLKHFIHKEILNHVFVHSLFHEKRYARIFKLPPGRHQAFNEA